MRNSVAFIGAPYGFCPSSKAVAISSYLPRSIERVFLSDGPPLDMARSSNEFSSCVHLDFSSHIASAVERLSSYGVLVFINSTRFIQACLVLGRPTILVETLAWLRDGLPPSSSLLSAYFAQRFFDHAFAPELEAMDNFLSDRAPAKAVWRSTRPHRGKAPNWHAIGRLRAEAGEAWLLVEPQGERRGGPLLLPGEPALVDER